MRKPTTAEMVIQFLFLLAGVGGMTLAALYYPDSSEIFAIIGVILTLGAVIAVAFYFSHRARKKST